MKTSIVIFGAGNIGRSFIGQVFSSSGYKVVFIDIDSVLVDSLNSAGGYTVVVRKDGTEDRKTFISPVEAILGTDEPAIIKAINEADLIATSVGSWALPKIFPVLARGIERRNAPVDIIIAENLNDADRIFREGLNVYFLHPETMNNIGLIQTSIGKMVPVMKESDLSEDRLQVFAEEYNTLIVDKTRFKCSLPHVPELKFVEPIEAYVHRKLYVHNLGHAAAAYLGNKKYPGAIFLWEVLEDKEIAIGVEKAMKESAAGLQAEYPGIFATEDLDDYIEDLLHRFENRKLEDTIYRVGRDLMRKLAPGDRLLGAFDITKKHNLPNENIKTVIMAAIHSDITDSEGNRFHGDEWFRSCVDRYSDIAERGFSLKTRKLYE